MRCAVELAVATRLSRWRVVCPLEAGTGATPARRAKQASERRRLGATRRRSPARRRSGRLLARRVGVVRVHEHVRATRVRARRLRRWPRRFGGRASAARAASRARRRLPCSSGEAGDSVRGAAVGEPAQLLTQPFGAVTITLRSCTSASRPTSTALRRAISNKRSASRRSPERGSASVSLASAARAVRIASSESSCPQPALASWLAADLEHRLAVATEKACESGAVVSDALDCPTRVPFACCSAKPSVVLRRHLYPAMARAASPALGRHRRSGPPQLPAHLRQACARERRPDHVALQAPRPLDAQSDDRHLRALGTS